MKKRAILLIVVLFIGALGPLAAEGGQEHHGFDWMGFLGKLFNSTVLFGGLIYLMRKPLIDLLSQKSLEVKNDLIHREQKLADTRHQLTQLESRLELIEKEVDELLREAKKAGETEMEKIKSAGEDEAARILSLTEEEIQHKVEKAVRDLKAKVADLTIRHFKDEIQGHLDSSIHERIVRKNIQISGDIIEKK